MHVHVTWLQMSWTYLSRGVGTQADRDMLVDLIHHEIIETDHLHVATTDTTPEETNVKYRYENHEYFTSFEHSG